MCRCCVARTRTRASCRSTRAKPRPCEGVEAVVTAATSRARTASASSFMTSRSWRADKVRYVGEAVAAVAAEDVLTARRALEKIKVAYEPITGVFDPEAAMRPGAPCCTITHRTTSSSTFRSAKAISRQGFAAADLIVEQTFETQAVEHAYLETEAGLAYVDHDGVVTIQSPSQNITHHRHMLARILACRSTRCA